MLPTNELFTEHNRNIIRGFYTTYPLAQTIIGYRAYDHMHGEIDAVFIGDSIFEQWHTDQAFPDLKHLNRGIGGDNYDGLYSRLDEDVFPNNPKKVLINIGINGIEEDKLVSIKKLRAIAEILRDRGIEVWCHTIAPLRQPCQRVAYQQLICEKNELIKELFSEGFGGYIDIHAELRDENGELAVEYAQGDGIHWTQAAYLRVAPLIRKALMS